MGEVLLRCVPSYDNENVVAPQNRRGKVNVGLRIGNDKHPLRVTVTDGHGRRIRLHSMSVDSPFIRKCGTEGVLSEHPRIRAQLASDGGIDLKQIRCGRTVERLRPSVVEQPPIDGTHDMADYFRFHNLLLYG